MEGYFDTTLIYSPSEFVDEYNRALEVVFPVVLIEGELLNYKVAQNKWVYGDIADDSAKVRLFGSVFKLQHQLTDGMKVKVLAQPRLHPQYGLSLNIESISPVGEGSIKKAAEELARKLRAEGLFDIVRKKQLPKYPQKVGIVTSLESAAFADFCKILDARWCGVTLHAKHVSVQGASAEQDIVNAIDVFESTIPDLDALVLIRGGGSPEDLQAFSTESVVRKVASTATPVIVGVGHEIDVSLAELAADVAASTPSNAAELLFPDKKEQQRGLAAQSETLNSTLHYAISSMAQTTDYVRQDLRQSIRDALHAKQVTLDNARQTLTATSPQNTLRRGYTLLTDSNNHVIKKHNDMKKKGTYKLMFSDGKQEVSRVK